MGDVVLKDDNVIVSGKLGVGTENPTSPLHVEGPAEIHSGGLGAGFSFADRHDATRQPRSFTKWLFAPVER